MPKTKIYCITCKRHDLSYQEQAQAACLGGADMLEFVDKGLTPKELIQVGQKLKEICADSKVPLIIDSRPDIALVIDADGVHVDQNDVPLFWARQILGGRKMVVISVDSLGQALSAAKDGATTLMVGPLYSPVNHGQQTVGVDLVRMIKERVKIPVIAFGGINSSNVSEVILAGADGVAVSRAICGAKDIAQALKDLRAKIESIPTGIK